MSYPWQAKTFTCRICGIHRASGMNGRWRTICDECKGLITSQEAADKAKDLK